MAVPLTPAPAAPRLTLTLRQTPRTRPAPTLLHPTQTPVTPAPCLIAKAENPARKGLLKMMEVAKSLRQTTNGPALREEIIVKINRVKKRESEISCKSIWPKPKNAEEKVENRKS